MSQTINQMVALGKVGSQQGILLCMNPESTQEQIDHLKHELKDLLQSTMALKKLYDRYGEEEGTRLMWCINELTDGIEDSAELRATWLREINKLLD